MVLTFDLDFGDILALGVSRPPKRCDLQTVDERLNRQPLTRCSRRAASGLEAGALILVEDPIPSAEVADHSSWASVNCDPNCDPTLPKWRLLLRSTDCYRDRRSAAKCCALSLGSTPSHSVTSFVFSC